jgi:hypothetical protein
MVFRHYGFSRLSFRSIHSFSSYAISYNTTLPLHLRNRKTALSLGLGLVILSAGVTGVAALALYNYYYSCCDSGGDYTMMFQSAVLYSGTASTPSSRGSAVFTVSISDPRSLTAIFSITITGTSFQSLPNIFECSNKTFCTPFDHVPLPGGKVSTFDTSTTAFYISSPVVVNETYNFVINFANGQSVSGSLIAAPPTSLPEGPLVTYSSMSISSNSYYYSSSCSVPPYTASAWANDSGTITTIVETVYC